MLKKEFTNSQLADVLLKKKAYRLSDVKDKIERVAFDIVRFKDGDEASNLWQIQNANDCDYIVAVYNDEEMEKSSCDWSIEINKKASEIHFYYKNDPIIKIASNKLGIPSNEIEEIKSYLPEKLSTNKKLVGLLLKELNPVKKKEIVNKYPELG